MGQETVAMVWEVRFQWHDEWYRCSEVMKHPTLLLLVLGWEKRALRAAVGKEGSFFTQPPYAIFRIKMT